MSKLKRLNPITRLFVTYGICGTIASLAHPVTPNLMTELNMPNYMFGVVFAAMAVTNFAMSPFWGNLNNYYSSRKILALAMIGYAIGQGIFGFGTTKIMLVIGRMIAGCFVSALFVTAPYYVLKFSNADDKASNLTKTVTLFSVCGTIGYLIGGVLGNYNIYYTIALQVVLMIVNALLFFIFLDNPDVDPIQSVHSLVKSSNPVQSFFQIKDYLSLKVVLLFLCVFTASFASTSLTQNFQYYLQTHLQMSSGIGGLTRSLVGLFSVIVNFTLTIKLLNSTNVERKITYVFAVMIASITFLKVVSEQPLMFTVVGISLLVMDTVQVSMLQDRNAHYSHQDNQGVMVGMHNSMKSLGMIGGSLLSGFVYDINPFLPFMLSLMFYLLALLFNTMNTKILSQQLTFSDENVINQ